MSFLKNEPDLEFEVDFMQSFLQSWINLVIRKSDRASECTSQDKLVSLQWY